MKRHAPAAGAAARFRPAIRWTPALIGLLTACANGAEPPGTPAPPVPGATDVESVVYLIGDAGAPDPRGEPVLRALEAEIRSRTDSAHQVIVFLGDNIYPKGMPPATSPARAEAERRALTQASVAIRSGADAIFIPGNHDWEKSGENGWQTILRQEQFIEEAGGGRVAFLPDRGCPGPALRDVGARLRLLLLDTEWWLRVDGKPEHPTSSCAADAEWEVLARLDSMMASADGRHVVVAGHHPMMSSGPHGGHFTVMEHIFPLREFNKWLWVPLPIIGSLYPIARKTGITHQDMSGSRNRTLRSSLDSVFVRHRPLAYASGHEHALQILDGGRGARYLVVSGTGIYGHVSSLTRLDETLYQAEASGYVRLDIQRDGRVRLAVVVVDEQARRAESFASWIEERR